MTQEEAIEIRERCLGLACGFFANSSSTESTVLSIARQFEDFVVNGVEFVEEKHSGK